jgi:hypothetical protein
MAGEVVDGKTRMPLGDLRGALLVGLISWPRKGAKGRECNNKFPLIKRLCKY